MNVLRDLPYVPDGHPQQRLDLYLPDAADGPVPLLVWIHGGGWRMGDKAQTGPLLPFVDAGYALASINYRLSQDAIFPAQIRDCRAAVRWLRDHAATYNLDPARIGVGGDSAGGHLAALLGTAADTTAFGDADEGPVRVQAELDSYGSTDFARMGDRPVAQQPVQVQAVLDWYGPTDFARMGGHHNDPDSAEAQLLGGPVQDNLDRSALASPLTYVTADAAPFLIFHGDRDRTVLISQSHFLVDALQEAGVEVTFRPIAGAGHGGPVFFRKENVALIRTFFARHLS